jgi:hypothetical protein
MLSACVVDRWIAEGASSARRDALLLPDGWSSILSPTPLSQRMDRFLRGNLALAAECRAKTGADRTRERLIEAMESRRVAPHPSMAHRSGAHRLWLRTDSRPAVPPRGARVAGGDLSTVSGLDPRTPGAAAAPAARQPGSAPGTSPPSPRGPAPAGRSAAARPCAMASTGNPVVSTRCYQRPPMLWHTRNVQPLLPMRVQILHHEERPVGKHCDPAMDVEERPQAASSAASPCSPRSAGGQRRGLRRCLTHCFHPHHPCQNRRAGLSLARVMDVTGCEFCNCL